MTAVTTIRKMTAADIPAGMRLCEIAGWNQVERDWQRFLDLEPEGCFVAEQDARVCATVTTLRFQNRFGWLGMLLADPATRRQGLGTRLLEEGCSYLVNAGVETVKLDGTPMGRNLYLQRGFVDEYEIQRWEGRTSTRTGGDLPPMTPSDLDEVCALDREIFGADRSRLLSSIWHENPNLSVVMRRAGGIEGYLLGREGSRARYFGPWVALSRPAAETLMRAILGRFPDQPAFVDMCLRNPEAAAVAQAFGFKYQRILSRMYRGPNNHPGAPHLVYGIAGPELG